MHLIDFTLTDQWEIVSATASDDGFAESMNELKKTHDIKFLSLERTEFGNIRYIIAKIAK